VKTPALDKLRDMLRTGRCVISFDDKLALVQEFEGVLRQLASAQVAALGFADAGER